MLKWAENAAPRFRTRTLVASKITFLKLIPFWAEVYFSKFERGRTRSIMKNVSLLRVTLWVPFPLFFDKGPTMCCFLILSKFRIFEIVCSRFPRQWYQPIFFPTKVSGSVPILLRMSQIDSFGQLPLQHKHLNRMLCLASAHYSGSWHSLHVNL